MTTQQLKVTHIQFFKYEERRQTTEEGDFEIDVSYSANVIINDTFVIQCSGNLESCEYSIPTSNECYWNNEDNQDFAQENYSPSEIAEIIEADGFENNIYFLEENGEKM